MLVMYEVPHHMMTTDDVSDGFNPCMCLVWYTLQWPITQEIAGQCGEQQQDLKYARTCRNEHFEVLVISLTPKFSPMRQIFRCCADRVRLQSVPANLQLLVGSSAHDMKRRGMTAGGGTCW